MVNNLITMVKQKSYPAPSGAGFSATKCICHKGFRGYSSVVARSKFRVGGQFTAPQSLTAHTLNRYGQA